MTFFHWGEFDPNLSVTSCLLSSDFIRENNPWFIWLLNVSVHGVEFVTMMIELFLNRQLMKISFIFITLPIQILFMFEAFLVYDSHKFWVYNFLNWYNDSPVNVTLRYIGFFILFIAFYFLAYGLHALRDFIGRKKNNSQKTSENVVSNPPMSA
ncbi:32296_t:CDS:2, partial [Racocetra persica]